jgi:hypothetical protein
VSSAPSSAPTDDEDKLTTGRIVAVIVFAVFAIAFIAAAFVYVATPARDLPGFMDRASTSAHHDLRGVGSFLVGLIFMVAAWFALRYRSLALEEAREAEKAAQATAQATASAEPAAAGDSLAGTEPMDATHS